MGNGKWIKPSPPEIVATYKRWFSRAACRTAGRRRRPAVRQAAITFATYGRRLSLK